NLNIRANVVFAQFSLGLVVDHKVIDAALPNQFDVEGSSSCTGPPQSDRSGPIRTLCPLISRLKSLSPLNDSRTSGTTALPRARGNHVARQRYDVLASMILRPGVGDRGNQYPADAGYSPAHPQHVANSGGQPSPWPHGCDLFRCASTPSRASPDLALRQQALCPPRPEALSQVAASIGRVSFRSWRPCRWPEQPAPPDSLSP